MSERANLHGAIDKRARRTRELLSEALLSLGAEREFDALSVGDLALGAGVARSTFYKHFASKDDFLVRSWVNLLEKTEAAVAARYPNRADLVPSATLFHHIAGQEAYVRSLVRSGGYLRQMAAGEIVLRDIVHANLRRVRPDLSRDRRQEAAIYVAAGFVGLLRWWMESGLERSPEDMQAAFARLTELALASPPSGQEA
jgi:AcrR family transcriptional regulator